MTVYLAFLRGVNVGGHRKLGMEELRQSLASAGLHQVTTYIQSGNVLFQSDEGEQRRPKIEDTIEQSFGFSSAAILRTCEELERLMAACPFFKRNEDESAASGSEYLHVALLVEPPSQASLKQLSAYADERNRFEAVGRDVYLWLEDGIRNSKLAARVEKVCGTATLRNWRTLTKLAELARKMG